MSSWTVEWPPIDTHRGLVDTSCRWFFKFERCWHWHRVGRPQRHPHWEIPPLRLQNIQQPSRIRSHHRRLSLAREIGVKSLTCKTDSKLTVGHLNDEFQIKDPTLLQYYHLVRAVIQSAFDQVRIEHISWTDNIRADILSKLVCTKLKSRHRSLLQQTLSTPSITNTCHNLIHTSADNLTHSQAHNWTTPYIQYLWTGNPPPDTDKTWLAKAARYTMIGDDLYKRGYGQLLLKCVTVEQMFLENFTLIFSNHLYNTCALPSFLPSCLDFGMPTSSNI